MASKLNDPAQRWAGGIEAISDYALLFDEGPNKVALVFFFSSRRRHTRSDRDWSSDVCSSDLSGGGYRLTGGRRLLRVRRRQPRGAGLALHGGAAERSEERRVGKECRSRWS